jgi:hypothetical protein
MAVHGRLSVVLAFVLTGLSTIVVALRYAAIQTVNVPRLTGYRFYSRHILAGKIGASDWVIFLALVNLQLSCLQCNS